MEGNFTSGKRVERVEGQAELAEAGEELGLDLAMDRVVQSLWTILDQKNYSKICGRGLNLVHSRLDPSVLLTEADDVSNLPSLTRVFSTCSSTTK